VTRALLYLKLTSLQNLVLTRVRRLRQPKYLIGAIAGGAYFYWLLFRRAHLGQAAATASPLAAELVPAVSAAAALLVSLIAVLCWVVPEKQGLNFTEAEIAFLFPAPISRKALVGFRLLSAQLNVLLSAAFFTLFSSRWSVLGGNALTHVVGWWLVLGTINLHIMGSSFAITRLMDTGVTPRSRRLVVLGLATALCAGAVWWVTRSWALPRAEDLTDLRAAWTFLQPLVNSGPLHWLLAPARWVVGPLIAPDLQAFATAIGPALGVFAAHCVWVLRAEASFEDASIAESEKRAVRRAAVREGKRLGPPTVARPPPFRLLPVGRPEVAFLWKNLLSTTPILRPRIFMYAAMLVFFGCRWLARQESTSPLLHIVGGGAAFVLGYGLLLGPMLARQDLRSDLLNSDILKTYPLRGWQVVLGEMLTPIAILTGVLWLALLAVHLSVESPTLGWLTPSVRLALVLGLLPVLPLLCTLQLVLSNATALLFPAWVQTLGNRTERGIEMMGQRLLFTVGRLLAVTIALVPASLIALGVVVPARSVVGLPAAIALGAVAVTALLALEAALGIRWLGARFDAFDLSAELRP
jgi:hypothetical protein